MMIFVGRLRKVILGSLCIAVGLFLLWSIPLSTGAKAKNKAQKKPLLINGAGASFPYILYSKWFLEYQKVTPDIRINYRSIGSGGGIRQFLTGALDFGATDVPMLKQQIQKSPKKILHIPTTLGAVVLSYNLKLKPQSLRLKLTAPLLASIYMGEIQKWNHEKIKALNPKLNLPDQNIVPIYRADGSGTTAVFTEYLSHFSKAWLNKSGKGKSVNWLTGIGGKGNEGVMGLIQKIPGSIGYVALSYASTRHLPFALVQNPSGHFVKADINTVKNSAEQILKATGDLFQPLITAQGPAAYPMSSYTYLLVYEKALSKKQKAITEFLHWALSEGQSFCKSLHYVPLPKAVIKKVQLRIKSMQNDSKTT